MNLIDELKQMKRKGRFVVGIDYVLRQLRESQREDTNEQILTETQEGVAS